MPIAMTINDELAITQWKDMLGTYSAKTEHASLFTPSLRLIRYDDAWRLLAESVQSPQGNGTAAIQAAWRDTYGGTSPFGRPPNVTFPHYWPATFDLWPYAGDMLPVTPMNFSGNVITRPVSSSFGEGLLVTISITDLRDPGKAYPQNIIRMPVGIELPLQPQARIYGTAEMFNDCRQLAYDLRDPALPRAWYYLESELFGGYTTRPGVTENADPGRPADPIHAGAPFVAASDDGHSWWGIASEADYGAATLIGSDRLRHFTTLYLRPGGVAEWSFVIWRQETASPQQLLLASTRADGFFNQLNPLGFTPKGAPAGPILFGNVSRLPYQLEEIRKLHPGLVLLNYQYDHISSMANLYGEWRTYEGFQYSEEKLKKLIAQLKAMGCQVGYYGTHATQPESHRVVQTDDYFLDAWGRRINDWEPGNWVTDPGHTDAAERYARAEAVFAHHYGLDAVFIDRLDFMGVNHNPARAGRGERLALVPSLRMGLIELNRQRMIWQRRLNPDLAVGLNNTTQWAGVRYSDFNLLEGGDDLRDPGLPCLLQPHGIVNKRHFPILFADFAGGNLFQVIGNTDTSKGFLATMRHFIRRSLVSGVVAQPYGDEIFVDRKSIFYQDGRDKNQPDEVKTALLASIPYYGGAEWRGYCDTIAPAIEAAQRLTVPVANVFPAPDEGPFKFKHSFLARRGDSGGWYVGLMNESESAQRVSFHLSGINLSAELPPQSVGVWWLDPAGKEWKTLVF